MGSGSPVSPFLRKSNPFSNAIVGFIRDRLEDLTQKYLSGEGCGDIFGCTYLTYLEVLYVALGKPTDLLWEEWRSRVQIHSDEVQPLNRLVSRQDLVNHLEYLWLESEAEPEPGPTIIDFLLGETQ